jgi:hypothetical protein
MQHMQKFTESYKLSPVVASAHDDELLLPSEGHIFGIKK